MPERAEQESSKAVRGDWMRFTRYELRNGSIAPAPKARLRKYDPWALETRPYRELAAIFELDDPLEMPERRPEVVAAVIDWCNRFGLLGTLLHRLVSVTYAHRWARQEVGKAKGRVFAIATQETHWLSPSAWITNSRGLGGSLREGKELIGELVERDDLPAEAIRPHALLIDLPGWNSSGVAGLDGFAGPIKKESLARSWARYFPDVPPFQRETYDYPEPGSEAFWRVYGEPVSEFVRAAYSLTDALEAILRPNHDDAITLGSDQLTNLASRASPRLEVGPDGRRRQRWVSGSLLSTLALMAMDDLAQNTIHKCAKCGVLFTATSYQAEYCSAKCRRTLQKRRYRERQRATAKKTRLGKER